MNVPENKNCIFPYSLMLLTMVIPDNDYDDNDDTSVIKHIKTSILFLFDHKYDLWSEYEVVNKCRYKWR